MTAKKKRKPASTGAAKARTQAKAAQAKFAQGILARGEAVPAGQPLTRGATHEIVGKTEDGTPILKRKRFTLS